MTSTASPLSLLPARARQGIYVSYGVTAIVVSGTQVGYAAVPGLGQPTWLTVTLAVVGFLAVPVASLAAANVGQSPATTKNIDLAEHPDVIAYQTGSGLIVAGEASPIPTGTPVDVTDPDTPAAEFGDEPVEPNDEFPPYDETETDEVDPPVK